MSLTGRRISAFEKKVQDLPDRPSPQISASDIKKQMDAAPEELRASLNGMIDDLVSAVAGSSGADQVGSATITGVAGSTVYTQLVALKALLDGAANQNAFSTVAVTGQGAVVADQASDTLTLIGGTGITISTIPGTDTITITATGEAVPGPHAASHVTGGADVIPTAVAGGNAGLMSGTDKARSDAIYANGGLPVTTNGRVSNQLITAVTATTLTVYPVGAAAANFLVLVYYNVITGPVNVTVDVDYTDSTGAQTNTLLLGQLSPVGSYSLLPLFLNAAAGTNITVKFTSSVANRAKASCTILGV